MNMKTLTYPKELTPIVLDQDSQDDLYLAELTRRAMEDRRDLSRHNAVFDWIN
jgi:hypothetical protein